MADFVTEDKYKEKATKLATTMKEQGYSDDEILEGLRLLKKKFSVAPTQSTSSESESPSQEQGASSVSVGVEPPTAQGDTTAEQGQISVQDFGDIQEPTESTKSLADDLGISVDQLLTKETIQDPKLVERNLGRPLPTESKYRVDGKPVYRDEMIDVINTNVDKIQAGAIDLEIDDDPELEQRLQRQIEAGSQWGDILESLGAGSLAMAQSVFGMQDLIATTLEEITGLPASQTMTAVSSRLAAEELGKKAEEIREKTRVYEGNFLEALANGNFSDAAFQGLNLTAESLPTTLVAAASGGGGGVGSYLIRSTATLTPIMASRELSENLMSEDPDVEELSQTQKVLRSWLFGGAEALGESVTGRIASKNFNLLKGGMKSVVGKAAQEVGEEGAKKTAKQMAIQTATDIAKNMGLDMNSEGASEAITEMAQMLTDDLMGTKNFSLGNYAQRMSNAYASGAFMGAVMGGVVGGVGITSNAVKRYRNTSLENIEKGLNTSVEQGEITQAQANEVMMDASAISQANPNLSEEAQAKQANLIKERTNLEQFLEGVDKSAAPKEYERVNQINEELTKIAEQDEKVQQEDQELREQEGEVKKEEERIRQEEQTIVADEKASIKEPVLEDTQDGGIQEEGEQESAELRSEEESSIEKIARVSGVKAKNIRGLYDINRKMWGLNRVKALAVSVIQDRTIGNQAKRTVVYEENGVEKLGVLDKRQEGGKVRINIGTNANPVYKVVTPKKVGISKEEMYSKIQFKKGDKTTVKDLSSRGKALFQIVGENENLADNVRTNLQVARDMEAEGKDAKNIRIATGWEKGADGKWRYEIVDFSVKTEKINGKKLSEIVFDKGGLFELYPDLKNIRIEVLDFDDIDFDANFQPEKNVIQISSYLTDKDSLAELNSFLLHEVQHAIQIQEGWGTVSRQEAKRISENAGNLGIISPYSDVEDNSLELINDIAEDLERAGGNIGEVVKTTNSTNLLKVLDFFIEKGLDIKRNDNIKSIKSFTIDGKKYSFFDDVFASKEGLLEYLNNEISRFIDFEGVTKKEDVTDEDAIAAIEAKEKQIKAVEKDNFTIEEKDAGLKVRVLDALESNGLEATSSAYFSESINEFFSENTLDEFDVYWRSQSEVEARNVQERMGMTPEQRRETLLQETEDVARDEQIVLFGDGNTRQIPQGVKFQIDAFHGSPYQFDKFTTEAIGTGVGALRSGWGLYFTKNKKRVEGYAKQLSSSTIKISDSVFKEGDRFTDDLYSELEKILSDSNGSRLYVVKKLLEISEAKRKQALNNNKEYREKYATEEEKQSGDYNYPSWVETNWYKYRTLAKNVLKDGIEKNDYPAYVYYVSIQENGNWLDLDNVVPNEQYDAILSQAKKENSKFVKEIEKRKGKSGKELYFGVTNNFSENPEKEFSLLLMRAGIDGNIGRHDTDTEYVVFDENAISIEEVIKFQKDAVKARGVMMMNMDGTAVIYALTDPNVSTPLHELAHVYEHYLTDKERTDILKWAKAIEWSTEVSEKFARGFEKYLSEGKAPTPMMQKYFDQFKNWLMDIYNGIVGSEIDIELNSKMRSIYDQMLTTQEESLGDMQEQPQAEEEATEGKKIRGAAKSASDLKNLAKEQREKILANPKNYYTPQVYEEIKDRMDTMDDSELVELMDDEALGGIREGDGNISVLAAVEAISRRLSDNKPIDDIVESMSKKGTSVAQALRQFAELKKSTPFGVLQYVNKKLSDFGVKMTEEQETELTQKVNDYLTAKAKFEQSKKKGADSLEETVSLEKEYQQAEREAMGMVARIVPKKFGDIVGATIQGNLLTPISQATNVVANVAQVPTRGGIEAVASIPDLVWSSLTGLPMTIKTTGLKAGAKGFVEGLSKAWEVILKGTNESDIAKGEVARSFAPMKAFAEAVSGTDIGKALTKLVPSLNLEKNRLPVSEKTGKPLTQERFKRLYESVFGFAPEVMFRLLSLGDKPFFYSEFNRALAEYAKEKGLTGKQKDFFMKYPDRLSQERAEQRAKEAVFMEESTLAKFSTKAVSELKNIVPSVVEKTPMPKWMADAISSAYRVLITTQIPFVRTPANVLSQTIDLAIPPLPLAKSAIYFRNARKIANGRSYEEMSQKEKADYNSSRRKGNINIGKAGVGAMMGVGASYLIANGLVSVLSGDDDEKTRNLQYQSFYPNTINLSGLERSLNGEDPSYRGGDRLIAFNKLGLFGMVLAIRAEQAKMDKRRGYKQTGKLEEQGQRLLSAIPAALRASFEQSFLAGTSSLLKALSGGERELDSWVRNSFKALSSVALPNTLSAINRAERDYLPDMRVEGIDNQLMAIIKDRTFQTHDMPVRVDFWGEKIRQTPEGADPYVYQMIDVFKSRESSTDQKNTMIYDLYSKTLDREVIPSMPPRTIKVEGLDMRLNPEQYNRLATIVGKERARIVNKYIGNRSFQKKNPEQKVSTLSSIYKSALKTRDYIKERNKIKEELRATIPK